MRRCTGDLHAQPGDPRGRPGRNAHVRGARRPHRREHQRRGGRPHRPGRDARRARADRPVAASRERGGRRQRHPAADQPKRLHRTRQARSGARRGASGRARRAVALPHRTAEIAKLFYGWKMVGAGCGLQVLQAGLLHHAFGGYLAVLQDDRAWNKTQLSGAAALQQIESAIIGPALGWIMDRFGPQGVIRLGVVMFGLGFIALSFIDSLLQFYAAFIVIALGSSMCGFFPINVALINWFERWRARALSALSLGLAVGGISVPIVGWSLVHFGWRATAFGSGVFAIAVGLPLAMVIRRRPEDHGETVDGISKALETSQNADAATPLSSRDFTAREALRTPAFWLLSLGHGFALLVVGAVNVHAIAHMKESLAYSVSAAALVIM